jgi:hypothetical protein
MNKELLEEAYSLYQTLYKACCNFAMQKQTIQYARYKKAEEKALNRYERRYQKFTKNH